MEGTDDRGTKEERALARCVSLLRLSSDSSPIPFELAVESVHQSLTDSSRDGSEVSAGYHEMEDPAWYEARQRLYNDSMGLIERLMDKMRKEGFKLGELRPTTHVSFGIPRCFTVECADGTNRDPYTGENMEMMVAVVANDSDPQLASMYNFPEGNDFINEHTAFLSYSRDNSYCVKTWCRESILYFKKAVEYQKARCDERRVHGTLMSYLSHRAFVVEDVPTPTDREDFDHFAYHDHCMVVISFADIDFKPATDILERCKVDTERGVVIELCTSIMWDESNGERAHVYANIYASNGKNYTIKVENCVDTTKFCSSCHEYLVTECARVHPPL